MQRYFASIINNQVYLDDGDVHHLLHVMRMNKGDNIEVVFDGSLFIAFIESTNPLIIKINHKVESDVELKHDVTLFFALAKGDKIDFVCQKATELGAKNVVLVNTKRCVTKFDDKDINKKLSRFSKIAKEASEQSHRLNVPNIIGVINLKDINNYLCDYNYVAYEKEAGTTENAFCNIDGSVSVFIGPEGGFDEKEVEYLESIGFKTVSLGKRILRTETAAVYALSVIGFLMEK